MKKLGLGLVGVIAVFAIYYFTAGATQLTSKLKTQIETELTTLQTQGFSVEGRETSEKKEHFILTFQEAEKYTPLLNTYGAQLEVSDAKALKGFQVGVDVTYLADAYSAASFDVYPVALPTLVSTTDYDEKEKKVLAQVEKMLQDKVILLHFSINKLGTGFKGNMKDIDTALVGEKTLDITMKGFDFDGDIKQDTVTHVNQVLKEVGITAKDELSMKMTTLSSSYDVDAKNKYNAKTTYSVEKFTIDIPTTLTLTMDKISSLTTTTAKGDLLSGTFKSTIKNIHIDNSGEKLTVNDMHFDVLANNIDIKAIEAIETIDPNDEEKLNALLQQLISKGIQMEIPTFEIASLNYNDQKMEGFKLDAKVMVDKTLDLKALAQNPMAAVGAIDASLNLILSNELLALIAQQPQAIMAMMLFQPKDENGKKAYHIELKDGSVKVNGQPIM